MKLSNALALATLVLLSAPAWADQASEAAAENLFESMDMDSAMDRIIDVSLDAEISQKPQLAPYKPVMRSFFVKYMSYSALKPQLVSIYASEFTAEELAQASEFYSTPTGKKLLSKLPALMTKGAEIGMQVVQEHLPELQAAIKEEADRLQELQGASNRSGT